MITLELHLDEQTFDRARQLAQARHSTVEAVITEIVATGLSEALTDPWLGLFADEPEVLDAVVAAAMDARERDALRTTDG